MLKCHFWVSLKIGHCDRGRDGVWRCIVFVTYDTMYMYDGHATTAELFATVCVCVRVKANWLYTLDNTPFSSREIIMFSHALQEQQHIADIPVIYYTGAIFHHLPFIEAAVDCFVMSILRISSRSLTLYLCTFSSLSLCALKIISLLQ